MEKYILHRVLFGLFMIMVQQVTVIELAPYTTTEATARCVGKPADVVFALDSSSSVFPKDFLKQLNFVKSVIDVFPIAQDKIRVGVLSFSNVPQPQFGLTEYNNKDDILAAVGRISQSGGDTGTDRAITFMKDTYFAKSRLDVPKIGIVITDGESDSPMLTAEAAKEARKAGIHLFAIGVGENVIFSELKAIAKERNVYMVDNFAELEQKVKDDLAIKTCEVKNVVNEEVTLTPLPAIRTNPPEEKTVYIPPPVRTEHPDEVNIFFPPPVRVVRPDENNVIITPAKEEFVYPPEDNLPPPVRSWRKKRPPTIITVEEACQKTPADLVFVLDSSTSIWGPDFRRQRQFLHDMVNIFHISENLTQVGVLTFSDKVHNLFHLNTYSEKEQLLDAVDGMQQIFGGTNTAAAIKYMREVSFRPGNGVRDNVRHIGVILTDGKSWNKEATVKQAELARKAGIHLFAVGIGMFVDEEEVRQIASPATTPGEENHFRLKNFKALDKAFRETLAIKTCINTEILAPAQEYFACAERSPTDVMFILDPTNAGARDHKKTYSFMKELVVEMEVSSETVKFGMIPKHCTAMQGFHFGKYENSEKFIEDADNFHYPSPTHLLKTLWERSFTKGFGAREDSRKMAVLVLNSRIDDLLKLQRQAQKLKANNIDMFVIGIGDEVNDVEMRMIASSPHHVKRLSSYDELATLKEHLLNNICGEVDFNFSSNEIYSYE